MHSNARGNRLYFQSADAFACIWDTIRYFLPFFCREAGAENEGLRLRTKRDDLTGVCHEDDNGLDKAGHL